MGRPGSCAHETMFSPSLPVWVLALLVPSGTVLAQGKEQPSSLELWLTKKCLVLAMTLSKAGPCVIPLPFENLTLLMINLVFYPFMIANLLSILILIFTEPRVSLGSM